MRGWGWQIVLADVADERDALRAVDLVRPDVVQVDLSRAGRPRLRGRRGVPRGGAVGGRRGDGAGRRQRRSAGRGDWRSAPPWAAACCWGPPARCRSDPRVSGPAAAPARRGPAGSGSRSRRGWRRTARRTPGRPVRRSARARPGTPARRGRGGSRRGSPRRSRSHRRPRSASAYRSTIRTGSQASQRAHSSSRTHAAARVERQHRTAVVARGEGRRAAERGEQGRVLGLGEGRPGVEVVPPPPDVAVVGTQVPDGVGEVRQVAVLVEGVARVGGQRAEQVRPQHRRDHRAEAAAGLAADGARRAVRRGCGSARPPTARPRRRGTSGSLPVPAESTNCEPP